MATKLGRPQIVINFKSKASTAVNRSGRGVGVIILNDENVEDKVVTYTINDSTEIPNSGLTEKSTDLIQKALLGVPSKLVVYAIPPAKITTIVPQEITDDNGETTTELVPVVIDSTITQSDALKNASVLKFNCICYPTGSAQDQENLATWVKAQRREKYKTIKAIVANVDADSYGVVNFTTGNIRVINPEYTDALVAAEGIAEAVSSDIPQYKIYTAAEYTARILGIACGISLD